MSEPFDYAAFIADVTFLEIAREETKRTILCEPHREHQIRAAIDQLGAADVLTVRPSLACPEGKLLVVDMGAIEAAERELIQRLIRQPWKFGA